MWWSGLELQVMAEDMGKMGSWIVSRDEEREQCERRPTRALSSFHGWGGFRPKHRFLGAIGGRVLRGIVVSRGAGRRWDIGAKLADVVESDCLPVAVGNGGLVQFFAHTT